jgi:D-amino-acid dehydrogenase
VTERVVIVGAGLAGLSVGQALIERGCDVIVLEARDAVASEASFANGAVLTPSMCDPWNGPGVHRHLAKSLFDPHAAMKLRWSAIPSLLAWGSAFLRNSTPARHSRSTREAFLLSDYSVRATRQLRTRLALEYGATAGGTMKLFRSHRAQEQGVALARMLGELGLRHELLDRERAVQEEPELADVAAQIVGALRFPDDESGDAHQFCLALAHWIERQGGRILLGKRASRIVTRGDTAVGVATPDGVVEGTSIVIAAGVHSPRLAQSCGVSLAIRPVKGYSLTLDLSRLDCVPALPVVDDDLHAAIVPMQRCLRVAGTAEFVGMDRSVRPERVANLWRVLEATYPRVARLVDRAAAIPWAGLRPVSADGLPFIGGTPTRGLYVNAGHGHVGWTMAVGSGQLLADIVRGSPPEIDPMPYRAARQCGLLS